MECSSVLIFQVWGKLQVSSQFTKEPSVTLATTVRRSREPSSIRQGMWGELKSGNALQNSQLVPLVMLFVRIGGTPREARL